MADSSVQINTNTSSGAIVDTRTTTGGEHRQVVVIGEGAATSDAVIPGDATNGLLTNVSDRLARQLGYVSLNSNGTLTTTATFSGSVIGVTFNSNQGSGTSTGAMRVELPTDGTGVVGLNAGTKWIGTVALASGTSVTTGAGVQAVTFNSALGAGTAAAAMRVELPTDGTGVVGLNTGFNWIGTVALASATSLTVNTVGTGATHLGKAEDAAHTTGDVGVMALAVQKTTATAFAADGDYVPLQTDANGNLRVNVAAAEGLDASTADASTFTIGVTTVASIAGVYRTPISALTSGQLGAIALTSNRAVHTYLVDGNGAPATLSATVTQAAVTFNSQQGSGTSTGAMRVELPTNGTGVVGLNAGFNWIGTVALASGTSVTTGAGVQAVTFNSALGSGTAAAAMRVELPTDGTGKVGLNAGTNLIGSVSLNSAGTLAVTVSSAGSTVAAAQYGTWTVTTTAGGVQAVTFNSALGAGTAAAAMRVELPTDGTGKVGLNSGTNWIGTVAIASGGSIGIFSAGSIAVSGDVAAAATDSGNPVKVGGKYNATMPALTDGQRGNIQVTSNSTQAVTVVPIATGYGWSQAYHDGLMASSIVTVASRLGPIAIGGWYIYNPNSSVAYVQMFNTNGTVTLGSHTPKLSLGIPATSAANLSFAVPLDFSLGLKIAATTTASNSTSPTSGVVTNWFYR